MKERELEDFYSATQATVDSAAKQTEADLFVDHDKIYMLTHRIKEKIENFQSKTSERQQVLRQEISYDKYLTTGEQAFLSKLGYAVKYVAPDRGEAAYYVITW